MDTQGGRRGRPPHPDILTPAEWHVLEHLRKGLTNAEIAVELGISPDGVKYHVSNMLAKLDLADRHALAKWKPPRGGVWGRIPRRGLLAGALGFCVAASATIGILAGLGVFGGGSAVPSNLPAIHSTLAITTYELTENTYMAPELLQPPISAGQSSAAAAALSGGIHQTVHVYFQAPDKSRTEKSSNAGSVDVELIDGGRILNWLAGQDAVMAIPDPFGRTNLAATNNGGWPADGTTLPHLMKTLANGAKVTLAGSDIVAGRPAYAIDVGPAPCPTGVPWLDGPKRYWLDKQTLFVLKAEQYMSNDHTKLASSTEITSITYNQPLDAALFAPPEGAKVENMDPFGGCVPVTPTSTPEASGTATDGMEVLQDQCGHAQFFGTDAGSGSCPSPVPSSTRPDVPTPSLDPYAVLTAIPGDGYSSSTTVAIMGH